MEHRELTKKVEDSILEILKESNPKMSYGDYMVILANCVARLIHSYSYPYKTQESSKRFYEGLLKYLDIFDKKEKNGCMDYINI